jgi:hypothetical protein
MNRPVRPRYLPLPYQDAAECGRLILRDGSTAQIRPARPESGFAVEEKLEGGEIEVDLSVVPSETSVARLEMRDRVATAASLRPFFQPRSVAVVGASRDPSSIGGLRRGPLRPGAIQC